MKTIRLLDGRIVSAVNDAKADRLVRKGRATYVTATSGRREIAARFPVRR